MIVYDETFRATVRCRLVILLGRPVGVADNHRGGSSDGQTA
jgi:hypothetical protein